MKKLLTLCLSLCLTVSGLFVLLTMQRYGEKSEPENSFNETPPFFSQTH